MKNTLLSSKWLTMMAMVLLIQVVSCKKDDPIPEVIASFTFVADVADFKKITFTNASQNYATSSWDFGDGSAKSTDANPVHTFPAAGDYNVVLTVTNANGKTQDVNTQKVTVSDPNAFLTALVGTTSKTWKMLRQVSQTGTAFPLQVGNLKADGVTRNTLFYQAGKNNDDIAKRPCSMNDEYIFTRAGLTFTRDLKGDFWAGDNNVYVSKANGGPEFTCATVGAAQTNTNRDGADISAWHTSPFNSTFVLTSGGKPTLEIKGLGAYIALEKVATNVEVKVPQNGVTYDIAKLYDAPNGTDTLVLVVNYNYSGDPNSNPTQVDQGYWQFYLVSYDNPANEPPLPQPKPVASFTGTMSGNSLTTVNTTTDGVTYLWDFGDGTTSTSAAPVHAYANDGIYNVKLTATNPQGSSTTGLKLFVANGTTPVLTDALLQGAAWKVQADDLSLFVGPGFGKPDFFAVPKADLAPAGSWGCLANDEFKFSAGGVFGYDTKGDVRNDGYMAGFANGCISDAQLATVTNDGKKLKTEPAHTYAFAPAAGANRATITVTNGGANGASAFLGFYKPFNGGENGTQATAVNKGATSIKYEVMGYAKNATKEYLFVSIDYSASQNGSLAWSFILVR